MLLKKEKLVWSLFFAGGSYLSSPRLVLTSFGQVAPGGVKEGPWISPVKWLACACDQLRDGQHYPSYPIAESTKHGLGRQRNRVFPSGSGDCGKGPGGFLLGQDISCNLSSHFGGKGVTW